MFRNPHSSFEGSSRKEKTPQRFSEFLIGWRYSDIRRVLEGEIAAPDEVFNTIHQLFTTYVDFRSDVEGRVLTLWTIGTYFWLEDILASCCIAIPMRRTD